MGTTRREFLSTALAAGAAAGIAGGIGVGSALARTRPRAKKMKLLILGGTAYLGPEIVEEALSRGHEMTLFNRGQTRPDLFPDLEKLRGDREGQLDALKGRKWDAVIDTSGYVPRHVRMSAELLKDSVDQYVFISSISAYEKWAPPGMDESAPEAKMPDPTNEDVGQYYGALKALCEHAAEETMPGRVTNLRPGYIIGPGDWTHRFNYWPCRVAEGGEMLAPGEPRWFLQGIDVRDLAAFVIECIEQKHVGLYNTDSPEGAITTQDMLDACMEGTRTKVDLTWVDKEFLESQGVFVGGHLPILLPPFDEYAGAGQISTAKARKAGLKSRPLAETARDAWEWVKALPPERQPRWGEANARGRMTPGLSREREKELLAAWKEHRGE